MKKSLNIQLLILLLKSFFLHIDAQDFTSNTEYSSLNPFTDFFKLHDLIDNLTNNSDIFPAFIDSDNNTDLFIIQNDLKISWYFLHFSLYDKKNHHFIRISNFQGDSNLNNNTKTIYNNSTYKSRPYNIQNNNSIYSNLITISSDKTQILLLVNPLLNNANATKWKQNIISNITYIKQENANISSESDFEISSFFTTNLTSQFENDIIITLKSQDSNGKSHIILLQNQFDGKNYIFQPILLFSIDNVSNELEILNTGTFLTPERNDLIYICDGQLFILGKNDADSWSDTSSDAASKLISEENFDDFEQNYALKIVDYNDDGFDDLVVLNKSSNEIFFVMNPNKYSTEIWLKWEFFAMKFISAYYENSFILSNLTDCIIFSFYDNVTNPDLNFICIFSTSLVFLYQNQNYTEQNLNSQLTTKFNQYVYTIYSMTVSGDASANWTRIFFKNDQKTNSFIVYSENSGEVAWIETSTYLNWDEDFGMSPNFWLYILLYCLFLLLIFGLFHTFVVLRYFHSKDIETEPLLKNSNKNANDELTSPTFKHELFEQIIKKKSLEKSSSKEEGEKKLKRKTTF